MQGQGLRAGGARAVMEAACPSGNGLMSGSASDPESPSRWSLWLIPLSPKWGRHMGGGSGVGEQPECQGRGPGRSEARQNPCEPSPLESLPHYPHLPAQPLWPRPVTWLCPHLSSEAWTAWECPFCFVRLFVLFLLFRAIPTAYGGSQARDQIGAVAASLHHSHSNAGSKPCLQPTP